MSTRRMASIATTMVAGIGLAACGSTSSSGPGTSGGGGASGTVNAAGSTFAAPIYQQWAGTVKGQGITLSYNSVGSGAGVTQLQGATVAFAGNDSPLKATDTQGMKGSVFQYPVAFGSITVSYNLPGVSSGVKLDGPTIASIFMGKVKTWNDPSIAALNPGQKLPSTAITVVHRSDSSGTTDGFTNFLALTSPTWASSIGHGKSVKWPVGTGGNGNTGVAAAVKQTPGAVGYVEQAYALQNGFTYASVKNKSGAYVAPSLPATSAAAVGIKVPANLGISTINSPNPSAYPIASQTFIDTYQDACKGGGLSSSTASALKRFMTYAIGAGQKTFGQGSGQIPYAPLPASLAAKDSAQLQKMTCNGSPVQ